MTEMRLDGSDSRSPGRPGDLLECKLAQRSTGQRAAWVLPRSKSCGNGRGPAWARAGGSAVASHCCCRRRSVRGQSLAVLKRFLEERWKGTAILWGPQLREEQLIQALYSELHNRI
jgi:hypothetical protein